MKVKPIEELKIGDVITSPKLGKGEFVVVKSFNERQVGCHNESDWYSWTIKIQKLRKDGTYSERAKTRSYYSSYGFVEECRLTEAKVVRRLKKTVQFK